MKLSKKKKQAILFFIIKTVVFILVGLIIGFVIGKKQNAKQTEKNIAENIVADEIEEVAEIVTMTSKLPFNYIENCKLSYELQKAVYDVCNDTGIPYAVALGLIEVESNFNENAVNITTGCYGLCQLNPNYFPKDLSPKENIRTGILWLAQQYGKSGDMAKALTIYNTGHDNGSRWYANKVLSCAEKWSVKNE